MSVTVELERSAKGLYVDHGVISNWPVVTTEEVYYVVESLRDFSRCKYGDEHHYTSDVFSCPLEYLT